MKITKDFHRQLEEFSALWLDIHHHLLQAGDLLVSMLSSHENAWEAILEHCPGATPEGLAAIERIGLRKLDPRMISSPSPAAQLAITRALPMRSQKILLESAVEVVTGLVDDQPQVAAKRIGEINNSEARRLIGRGELRSVQDQTRLLREQQETQRQSKLRYRIVGAKVLFQHDTEFDYAELLTVLNQIAPSARELANALKENQIRPRQQVAK